MSQSGTIRLRSDNTRGIVIGPSVSTSAALGAALEVISTTGGLLFPRMDTTQRNALAASPDGLVIYNTTTNKLQVRAAGTWVDLH